MSTPLQTFAISCQIGFEELVKKELLHVLCIDHPELKAQANQRVPLEFSFESKEQRKRILEQLTEDHQIKITPSIVTAKLSLPQFYNFIFWSRVAARVLLVLSENFCDSELELYNNAYAINWDNLLHPGFEFKVNFNGTSETLKNSNFSALRVKDAIVDSYTKRDQERPNVNIEDPDLIIDCRLHRQRLMISLDLTGPMHKRYRERAGSAPMRETLAANLILRSGWDKRSPVYNPMCGSGVLAIEAAMIALNVAPGLYCEQHHLDYWKQHQVELWSAARDLAQASRLTAEELDPSFKVYASDNDKFVLMVAQNNADKVGVSEFVEFSVQEFANVQRVEQNPTGLVIINPPYGVRLAQEKQLVQTYYLLGKWCKQLFPGWLVGVISSSEKLLNNMGLQAAQRWKLKNSNLDCQYLVCPIHQRGIQASKASTSEQTDATSELDATTAPAVQLDLLADEQATALHNRLKKNLKTLNGYLKRKQVTCYRLYDADIPEFNFSIDHYQDRKTNKEYYVIQEYAAPKNISLHKTVKRSLQALAVLEKFAQEQNPQQPAQIIDKLRERQKGDAQYNKITDQGLEALVAEYDLQFKVNLTDYIDTGIFLDNRDLRYYLRSHVVPHQTRFLNLFSYTSTATCHAIQAQAAQTVSVDMSASYCGWSEDNFNLNFKKSLLQSGNHQIVQANVLAWLDHYSKNRELEFDLVFCDPPTFSNSKRMEGTFDVQRDHIALLTQITQILSPSGKIVFCNNKRNFKLDTAALEQLGYRAEDITMKTMPDDFKKSKIHQAWLITKTA